jgi:hypothetical protein
MRARERHLVSVYYPLNAIIYIGRFMICKLGVQEEEEDGLRELSRSYLGTSLEYILRSLSCRRIHAG